MADTSEVLDRSVLGYDEDFCRWAEAQAALLRAGRFDDLDIENLAEEIDLMSGRDRDAIESNLVVLLKHLLKYRYQPERRSGSWTSRIIEHRRRVISAMDNSPSLRRHLVDRYQPCYRSAREQAAAETGLPLSSLPKDPISISTGLWTAGSGWSRRRMRHERAP